MPSGEHTHVMNARERNPRYGTTRADGSKEPEYIPHSEPARANQTDYRCDTCGKTHDELIPANDPSRRSKPVEIKSEPKAPSKSRSKSTSKKATAVAEKEPAKS